MTTAELEVGVVLRRRPAGGAWPAESWEVAAIVQPTPVAEAGSALNPAGGLVYAGARTVDLQRGETAAYRDNLTAEHPTIWVALEPVEHGAPSLRAVTVHPGEGEAWASDVGLLVEVAPMPKQLAEVVAGFIATFHVEQPFMKRNRNARMSP